MAIYSLSPVFQPQYVGSSAAALAFASSGNPTAVPVSFNFQISVLHVANKTAAPVSLKMWRVPSGSTNDDAHIVVPTINIPVATNTSPYFDVTALWGAILQPGDAIWAIAGAGSSLIIQGDGAVISILRADVTIQQGFAESNFPDLWMWLNTPREPNFDVGGITTLAEFKRELIARMPNQYTWGIYAGEDLVGFAAFQPDTPNSGQFRGMVIRPSWRRLGVGSAALTLVLGELEYLGIQRLSVMPFADNEIVRRIFRKAGFAEGRQYISMFKGGA